MEDDLEDKLLYQTFKNQMKFLSKFVVGVSSINSPLAYTWKLCRLYILRPEVIFCGIIIFIFLCYLQAVDTWSRNLLSRISSTLGYKYGSNKLLENSNSYSDNKSWEDIRKQSAAFAVLGRRQKMEDRFYIDENINQNTGISIFAIFDGHGGEFVADYAKDVLIRNLVNKIIEANNIVKSTNNENVYIQTKSSNNNEGSNNQKDKDNDNTPARRKSSFRKSQSTKDDYSGISDLIQEKQDRFTSKLNALIKPLTSDSLFNSNNNNNDNSNKQPPPPVFDAKTYIDNENINFGKMVTDEVLAADYKLIETAKKTSNVAGSTLLIAILQGSKLIVANVGDSRGVMCDSKGNAIPLSFDHKPQQVRERKRIHDAGGFIAFRGVWRVAGILATSRALGDYPLKDKNLVIANPDILTFELNDHKPSFLILASDGLWDTFSNEEAVAFIKDNMYKEPQFGAKALAMQSYHRGSVDNITVLVIVFKNDIYQIGSSENTANKNDK